MTNPGEFSPTREKAARLIREKRVHYQYTTPDGGLVYWVDGDSGRTRTVTVGADGLMTCDCPAMIPDCAHRLAVDFYYQPLDTRPGTVLSPDDPLEHIPTPETRADLAALPDPDEPGELDDTVDDDDETVQVLGDDGPVPVVDPEQRRDLIDLSTAPVTWRTLEIISRTEFVPASIRGKPAACLAAILTGREYGLGPMESLRQIAVIDGSPTLSAELTLKLYRQAGHRIDVEQADTATVKLTGTRGDTGEQMTVTYDLADAERAGLVQIVDGEPRARSSNNRAMPWESYTPDLLWARAVTRLVRRLAPDLGPLQ